MYIQKKMMTVMDCRSGKFDMLKLYWNKMIDHIKKRSRKLGDKNI